MTNATRIVALLAALVLSGCGSPRLTRAEALPAVVSVPSAEAAVRRFVESQGGIYAGDCGAAVSPGDVGKLCSRFVAEQNGIRAYLLGRTFSEFSAWLFIAPAAGGWVEVGTAPLDFFAPPDVPWP